MGGLYFLLGFLIKSVLFNAHPDARYLLSLIKPLVIVKPRPCCPTGAGSVSFFFFLALLVYCSSFCQAGV